MRMIKEMNEIKFRIYNPEKKKMIESGATPMMLHSFFEHTAVLNTRDKMVYQQFTGLLDKNGVEIWKGDIVKRENFNAVVKEIHGCWMFERKAGYYVNAHWYMNDSEVIGNIYENKELIK
jgi:uncharacterized phage protein (TIGR01671 family)